ncbi:MAG: hypothetical protein U0401_18465 [Anaerolineae bacterium]
MKTQLRHLFSWWILDLSAVLLIGLLGAAHWLVASTFWRQAVDIVLLLGIYGLIDWWIRRHHRDMDDPQIHEHAPSRYSLEMKD